MTDVFCRYATQKLSIKTVMVYDLVDSYCIWYSVLYIVAVETDGGENSLN